MRKFISYNKFEDQYIKVPDDYKKKKINKNFIENYYCGNKIYLDEDNILYKKIKNKHKGYKTYFTHWNGGKPYLVYVKKDVYIYSIDPNKYINKNKYAGDNKWMYINLVKYYKPEKIMIGKSLKNTITESSGLYGEEFDGNTILLKIDKNKYIYINFCIISFTYKYEIIQYFFSISHDDIPCSYGIDTENNYILLHDLVILHENKNFTSNRYEDPILYYNKIKSTEKNNLTYIKKKIINFSPDYLL